MASGDDVGGQDVFQTRDLVLQHQLLLFQPAKRKLVRPARRFHRMDGVVKVAVFLAQDAKFHPEDFKVIHFKLGVHSGTATRRLAGPGT